MSAKYTVELRSLMNDSEVRPLIDRALSTYPLYESKNDDLKVLIPNRSELNSKLLNHYKYREIGFETIGRFIDELEITMNEIMPYYNERFKTVEIMSELPSPFDNVDVIEKYTEERTDNATSSSKVDTNDTSKGSIKSEGETNTSGNTENSSKNVHTTTPSNTVSTPAENIDSVTHADEVTWNKENNSTSGVANSSNTSESDTSNSGHTESEGTSENKSTISHTFTKTGNQGVNTYAHDMNEFRTSLIDVVYEIITDTRVSDLFMKVY